MARLYIAGLSEVEDIEDQPRVTTKLPTWLFYIFTAALSLWLFAFVSGLFPWLGWSEGSSRHGASGARIREDTSFGMPVMYLVAGQTAVWDYRVRITGSEELLLKIGKVRPQPDFIVKVQRVNRTGQGRFEVVAPVSGFYTFKHELAPVGGMFNPVEPGSIYYRMAWGIDAPAQ